MGCEAGRCNKTSTPLGIFIVKLANQGSFSPWGKTNPAGHKPSISMSCGNIKKIPALFIIKLWTINKKTTKFNNNNMNRNIWHNIYFCHSVTVSHNFNNLTPLHSDMKYLHKQTYLHFSSGIIPKFCF